MMYMYMYSAQSVILTRVSHGSGGTIYLKIIIITHCYRQLGIYYPYSRSRSPCKYMY